ncbi:sensor histidine kinase [Thalassolituus sp. LLYu03]|uniref:sensor histidine kinase n=1 Tax=Thalassolituus sp. LLYu03 TaxID=3421656 RepID=UPI003D2C2644
MPATQLQTNLPRHWLIALTVPMLVTFICWLFDHILPDASLVLFYLAGVLLTAFTTAIRPALLAAVISFLAFNFFFTAPHYTLYILHREDLLTASILILVALVTGHLAAGLREKVQALETSMRWTRQQMTLAQALANCISADELLRTFAAHTSQYAAIGLYRIEPLSGISADARRGELNVVHGEKSLTLAVADADGQPHGLTIVFLRPQPAWAKAQLDATLELLRLALSRVQLIDNLQQETVVKEREQLRSALLSSISHDLRTPLATMIGSVSSLCDLRENLSESQQDELLKNTLSEARRLDRYIQKLLDMTKIGQGELKLERDWVGMDDIISVALRRLKPLLDGQQVNTDIEADLPLLFVHAALLEQAVFNVLENAVRYTPAGAAIRVQVHRDDRQLLVDITDSGPGIPEAQWPRLFDMFYTLARGDQQTGGTGLGLTICQGILAAHGGQVKVLFSAPETGTCFRLSLPLERNMPAEDSE